MTLLRRPRTAVTTGALLLLAGLWASCGRNAGETDPPSAGRTPVRVTRPVLTDFTETIDLNANTIFLTREVVRATFQGFIERAFKTIGEDVKAGDPLFLIKTRESEAADSLGIRLGVRLGTGADGAPFSGSVEIRAKTDGMLTSQSYNTGDFVSDGEQIATVSNPASLRLALNVPFAFARRIRRAEPCMLMLPDGSAARAHIQRALPSVDSESQTQTFLLKPDGEITLPENLNVIVRLPLLTARRAAGVPIGAVMSDEAQETFLIMKLVNDSTAVRFDAVKGIENDSLVQIVRPPLGPSDRVVSEGAYGLPDTASVSIIGK
jgi:multidrug efflux pump subunit AcrA (membrane-fusion protein)